MGRRTRRGSLVDGERLCSRSKFGTRRVHIVFVAGFQVSVRIVLLDWAPSGGSPGQKVINESVTWKTSRLFPGFRSRLPPGPWIFTDGVSGCARMQLLMCNFAVEACTEKDQTSLICKPSLVAPALFVAVVQQGRQCDLVVRTIRASSY